MLNKANTVAGYKLQALDGEIGDVEDFYFDDRNWAVRYLVANTGNWLTGRQVLLSPHAMGAVNAKDKSIAIALTKKQIENSPSLDSDKPVSRQFEEAYYGYYGWPLYWDSSTIWGEKPYVTRDCEPCAEASVKPWDSHLRSAKEVDGYSIQADDGEIGHVDDFILDDGAWAIRYLVVDTRNWWPGKKVLLSPRWIEGVSWDESKVFVNLARKTIKESPEYSEESLVTRDYEASLHRHYSRKGYWDEAKRHSL